MSRPEYRRDEDIHIHRPHSPARSEQFGPSQIPQARPNRDFDQGGNEPEIHIQRNVRSRRDRDREMWDEMDMERERREYIAHAAHERTHLPQSSSNYTPYIPIHERIRIDERIPVHERIPTHERIPSRHNSRGRTIHAENRRRTNDFRHHISRESQAVGINFPIQVFYQTGEGLRDIELLLRDRPRRRPCPHPRGRDRLKPPISPRPKPAKEGKICECGRPKAPEYITFVFSLVRNGKYIESDPIKYKYPPPENKVEDSWLISEMKTAYHRDLSSTFSFLTRRISLATYLRREDLGKEGLDKEWDTGTYMTAKIGFMRTRDGKAKSIFRRHFSYPDEHNRVAESTIWIKKFDELIRNVDGNGEFIIEVEEEMNFAFFLTSLLLLILLSILSGILYAVFKHDISTAISLSSYIVTCLALLLALFAIGDYIGLRKPDISVWYDYNSETGDFDLAAVGEPGKLGIGEYKKLKGKVV